MRYPSFSSCLCKHSFKEMVVFFMCLFVFHLISTSRYLTALSFPHVTASADSYILSYQVDLSNFLQQQPRGFSRFGFGNDLTNCLTHLKVCFCYE